jgi:hypothetical protein
VVLGFTAVVTALGWSYLATHSTVVPEAVNRYGAVRAQYLAESGAAIASHFLMYPPTTVPACDYWHGANNIAVDAGNDYTNVTVTQDSNNRDTFTITAVGVALNPDATVRGKQTIVAKVIRPPSGKLRIPFALLADTSAMGGTFTVPSTVKLYGDLHGEGGSISSSGWSQSKVSATGAVCWSSCGGTGPPSAIVPNAASFPFAPISAANYATYSVQGSTYRAYTYSNNSMSSAQAGTLNTLLNGTMANNPGRVVYGLGNLRLDDNATLNCTLAVTGDLQVNGSNIQVTAVQDYPAAVVSGNIIFQKDNKSLMLAGPLLCGGQILDNNKNDAVLDVTGTCILKRGFVLQKTNGTYRFTWDCNRSVFWDFTTASGGGGPMTILSWKEN